MMEVNSEIGFAASDRIPKDCAGDIVAGRSAASRQKSKIRGP